MLDSSAPLAAAASESHEHEHEKTPSESTELPSPASPLKLPALGEDEAKQLGVFRRVSRFLLQYGIETHGVTPIPVENRTDKRMYQMFVLWFTVNFNILAFSTGSAGPAFFSLGIRDSALVLLVVDVVTCAVPAYFLYGAAIPSILNVFSSQGFLVLNCIIGGQALAAVSDKLDDTLGIVIIGVISLVVTFFGYRVVHWFESFAWIPNVIAFPLLLGLAGKHLNPNTFPPPPAPASAADILSFGSLVASSVISWCTLTPDYGVYHDADAPTFTIFVYTYLGFFIPSFCWHMIGAALTTAANVVPAWGTGFDNGNNLGGLLAAVLSPAKGFGKFMLVLIAISTSSACAPTMYTFGMSFMAITPFFARVPRYMFALISEAILIPVAIIGAKRFYATLVDILSIIGYWSTAFAAIILTEHFLFRRARFASYQIASAWDKAHLLPPGFAAVFSFVCSFGAIVPFMEQTWYTGPVARMGSGDLGVLVAAVVGSVTYALGRAVERRVWPERRS